MSSTIFSPIVKLPTKYGIFKSFAVKEGIKEHFVLYQGKVKNKPCLVRIHSECLTGDVFHSLKCDCGEQLDSAMQAITKEPGILIYLRQEGRDIGLFNKMRAYKLQESGYDTVEANLLLGLPIDNRNYSIVGTILQKLSPGKITVLTNNPKKCAALQTVVAQKIERRSTLSLPNKFNQKYLATKFTKLNHLLEHKYEHKISPGNQ